MRYGTLPGFRMPWPVRFYSLGSTTGASSSIVSIAGELSRRSHGGDLVSKYLKTELPRLFETSQSKDIPELYDWIRSLGGYFKRFRGGILAPWIHDPPPEDLLLDLETRATLTFFTVDRNLSSNPKTQTCGATASVALLHSLDVPSTPFFAAKKLALTVAHCG